MPRTKAPMQSATVKVQKFCTSLKVVLTVDEIADRADRAAQMVADRDAKEEEQKAQAKHAKSIIETIDADIRRLSNEVRTRSTYRQVECERQYDYAAGVLRETRLDTGEVFHERELTTEEKQRELFQGDGATEE